MPTTKNRPRLVPRTCAHCEGTFTTPRGKRPPATCSAACKRARGPHGDVRLTRHASTGTGVLDMSGNGSRHSSDDNEEILDLLGEPDNESRGWVVASGESLVTDETGRAVLDDEGRAETRFRNHFAEANANAGAEQSVTPHLKVIGSTDLPWDWQERLDAGESFDSVRLTEWLGEPVAETV